MSARERFPHPYKECFVPLFNVLAGTLPGDGLSPPLTDIVLFGLYLSSFPSRFLNASTKERLRGFHTLKRNRAFSFKFYLLNFPSQFLNASTKRG